MLTEKQKIKAVFQEHMVDDTVIYAIVSEMEYWLEAAGIVPFEGMRIEIPEGDCNYIIDQVFFMRDEDGQHCIMCWMEIDC